ncbi:MAG TPA: DegT/DnrJ/EryC1/StrS family aminotransferase, partial [Chitinophagaceae bacterium]
EGGVMVTNDEATYKLADSYCDHGHDHIGTNRGMEQHPIIGFNYRISELHAAVGKAQTARVPEIIRRNNKNKKLLTDLLSKTEGISFAELADPSGDSATFLNMFLPDAATTKAVVDEFNKAGVGGFNYWFINMYHFINQWDHVKQLKTASKLAVEILGAPQDYNNLELPKTQEVIGRLISFGIRCTWTEDEIRALANNISACVKKVLIAEKA